MAAALTTTPIRVADVTRYTPTSIAVDSCTAIVLTVLPVYVDGVTRMVTDNPVRRWTGAAWNPAPKVPAGLVQCVVLVIPNPIRRWTGASWEPLYVPN